MRNLFGIIIIMIVVLLFCIHFAKLDERERVYSEMNQFGSVAHTLALQVQGCKEAKDFLSHNYVLGY